VHKRADDTKIAQCHRNLIDTSGKENEMTTEQ